MVEIASVEIASVQTAFVRIVRPAAALSFVAAASVASLAVTPGEGFAAILPAAPISVQASSSAFVPISAVSGAADQRSTGERFHYRRVCRMEPRYDVFGRLIGFVRVCKTTAY